MNNANQNIADNTINLVRRIVREFTFDKDQLKLWKESLGRTNIINLQVAKSDMPRIIERGPLARTLQLGRADRTAALDQTAAGMP